VGKHNGKHLLFLSEEAGHAENKGLTMLGNYRRRGRVGVSCDAGRRADGRTGGNFYGQLAPCLAARRLNLQKVTKGMARMAAKAQELGATATSKANEAAAVVGEKMGSLAGVIRE
jgi:hypothetical protein